MTQGSAALSPHEMQRWTRVGMLAALAMLLGYAETFVPIPIPGVKLGLANAAVLAALAGGDVSGAFCVALIKALATGLLFGSPLTLAYSLVGTLVSFAGMAPLSRLRSMRLFMVSVVGSLLHECGQLLVARLVLGTSVVWMVTPVLLVAGCATGVITGVLAEKLAQALPSNEDMPRTFASPAVEPRPPQARTMVLFGALVAYVVIVLRLSDLAALGACVGLSLVACLASLVRPAVLASALRFTTAVGLVTFALQLIVTPSVAAAETARACTRLLALAWACAAFAQATPNHDRASTLAWALAPLTRRGMRTQGLVVAFDVAWRLLPTMGRIARNKLKAPTGSLTLKSLGLILPELVHETFGVMWHEQRDH